MNQFDIKAREWDKNTIHTERTKAIAATMLEMIPLSNSMKALEYGAGTGLLSFELAGKLGEVLLMDSSNEMIRVANEKIIQSGIQNIKAKFFDLEKEDYNESKFDIIFNQMVLHHIGDVQAIFQKFFALLTKNGILSIADIYTEDGSFHDGDFTGHKGFEPTDLQHLLEKIGFKNIAYRTCFTIKKVKEDKLTHEYPVFLLVAQK